MSENRELALILKLVADQFSSELKKQQGALGSFNNFIKDWKTQLAAAGGALFAIAKSTASYGEELLKMSQKTGASVEALAGLKHAANLADVSSEQLTAGMKFLAINMVEAGKQTGDGAALFRSLGLSATDATGKLKPVQDVLLDVAESFAQSKDGAGKAEMAVKLFGKAGLDLIPFLNQGKTGITEFMDEAVRLGLILSKEDAVAADLFNNELKKLTAASRGLTLQVGKELIPAFTQLMGTTKEMVQAFSSLGVGSIISAGMKDLQGHLIGINALIKEAKANWQFLFGTGKDAMNVDQLKERIAYIEAEASVKLRTLSEPGKAFSEKSASVAGSGTTREIAQIADQEKLGRALVEIFKSQNNAIEIRNKLMQEGTNEFFLQFDRQEQFRKEDEAYQESRGRLIVEQTGMEVRVRDEAMAKERDDIIANEQAWVNYYEEFGSNTEAMYTHKMDLLRGYLAKELELNERQAANLLMAWQNHDSARADAILADSPKSDRQKETIELNTMRQSIVNLNEASGDFFTGWASGMRNYIKDTKTGFGLAADMARRTAQAMEQGFRNFFFDAMEGKIKGLKDLLKSLLDFAKQIISQIMAQMVMAGIAQAFSGAAAGGKGGASDFSSTNFFQHANGGIMPRTRFAMGGIATGMQFAMFGEGSQPEAFVPLPDGKTIPVTMKSMGQPANVSVPITINVANQVPGTEVRTERSTGADGRQQIDMMIIQTVKKGFSNGTFDGSMQRFGSGPQPIGR